MITFIKPGWIFLCLLNIIACTSTGQTELDNNKVETSDKPTKRQLRQSLRDQASITIVYGNQDQALAKAYQQVLEKGAIDFRWIDIEVKNEAEIDDEDFQSKIIYLVGTPQSNARLAQVVKEFPFQLETGQFHFAQKKFAQEGDIINLALYPHPQNPTVPINVLTGVNDQSILQHLQNRLQDQQQTAFSIRWNYQVYRQKKRVMIGHFSEQHWKVDRKVHFDFSRQDTLATSPHFYFITHQEMPPSFQIDQLVEQCEKTYRKIEQFCQKTSRLPRIAYHIYATAEDKGLMTNNTNQAHYNFARKEVHTVINEQFEQNFLQKENHLLLQHLLGEAKTQALFEGLGICFTNQWQQKGYRYWTARLQVSGNVLSLKNLLDNEQFEQESWLIRSCLSGVFVDFLVEEFGQADFLKHYTSWAADEKVLNALESKWSDYLNRLVMETGVKTEQEASANRLPYLKGFNFAHEGYAIYNGYISRQASQALEKLSSIGTNAVSIIPYSYMRDPNRPTHIPLIRSAGAENDESVIHAAFEAKKRGMTTLLKPQIWLGSSWPGDVAMNSEADWQLFFKNYYRWILHYTFLAEIHQMDMLCVGVEFAKATLNREKDWRTIFRKLRGLYSGKMTYCANWGKEFEQVKFWDELDYIGLSCYYPLGYAQNTSKKELQKNFNKILSKIESVHRKYQKPVLFTEIGFRSIEAPWQEPHAEANGKKNNLEDQKKCYEVVFQGLQNQDWCHGLFWWKWPCHMNYVNPQGFTPMAKPAEQVVEDWFGKMPAFPSH